MTKDVAMLTASILSSLKGLVLNEILRKSKEEISEILINVFAEVRKKDGELCS